MDLIGLTTISQMDPQSMKYLMEPSVIQATNSEIPIILGLILITIVVICYLSWLGTLFEERKSTKYRKVITDMYVAGTVKKFAKEDSIDIEEEYKCFQKWEKKKRNKHLELDSAIEENLKDKVSEKTDVEISKLK